VHTSKPGYVNSSMLFGMSKELITENEFESVLDREKLDMLMKITDFNKMSVEDLSQLCFKFKV